MVRAFAGLLLLLLAAPALAADPGLFTCRVIVTGTDMRTRPDALERCLRQVAVKVTGRPSLADDPRVSEIAGHADALIEDFAYLDRMSDIPHHDEQGTRDRPYDLVAHVQPTALEQALARAGLRAWFDRPRLVVRVSIEPRDGASFRLSADADVGERQRQALLAAADRFGIHVALPTEQPPPFARPGDATLEGKLAWSDADFGWNADWRLAIGGTALGGWEVRGVSFDEAFRAGVGGAAERLSAR